MYPLLFTFLYVPVTSEPSRVDGFLLSSWFHGNSRGAWIGGFPYFFFLFLGEGHLYSRRTYPWTKCVFTRNNAVSRRDGRTLPAPRLLSRLASLCGPFLRSFSFSGYSLFSSFIFFSRYFLLHFYTPTSSSYNPSSPRFLGWAFKILTTSYEFLNKHTLSESHHSLNKRREKRKTNPPTGNREATVPICKGSAGIHAQVWYIPGGAQGKKRRNAKRT